MTLFRIFPVIAIAALFTACGGGSDAGASGDAGKTHASIDGNDVLNEFRDCTENNSEPNACKDLTAKAICGHCGISDFVKTDQPREYVSYEEISGIMLQLSAWRALGDGDDQSVLDKAQALANKGGCVVAINTIEGKSNIAWILPGEMEKSTSWKLNCPNSATFIPHSAKWSYVGKTLNYAWKSSAGVVLYARKTTAE